MAFAAPSPTTFTQIVGDGLTEFRALATKHCDGWGIASDGNLITEPESALNSQKFSDAIVEAQSRAALLHLRWATLGLKVDETNTHPFSHGEYSFIHNGSIKPPSSIETMIDPDLLPSLIGDTDSERYFYALLSSIGDLGLTEGTLKTLRTMRDNLDSSSLNAMLLSPDKLVIICEYNLTRVPPGEDASYYDLAYRKDAQGVLIASSGWDQSGWNSIGNHHLLIVNRTTLEVERHQI